MKKCMQIGALLILGALLLTACTPAPNNSPSPSPTMPLLPSPSISPSVSPMVSPDNGNTNVDADPAIMTAVKDEVAKLSEVKEAVVIMSGDTVLVGLTFDEQYKGELTDRIKEMVVEKVKAAANGTKEVLVSAQNDVVTKIKTLADGVSNTISGTGTTVEQFDEVYNLMKETKSTTT